MLWNNGWQNIKIRKINGKIGGENFLKNMVAKLKNRREK